MTPGERWVGEYFDRIHAYVRMRVPPQDCEDVVGDIFLRAVQCHSQLQGEAGAWLLAIARSKIADYYRKRGPLMRNESTGLEALESTVETAGQSESPAVALEKLEHEEFRERLRRCLTMLSEIERDAIAFKFTDGLNNTQIATALGMTPGHLGVVLHRALKRLREAMLAEGYPAPRH